MQILRPDPIHPIRKRLWQAAGAVGLIVFMLVARETIIRNIDGSHQLSVGRDLLPVYAAGRLLREGRAADLYAMEPLAAIERQVVAEADLEPLRAYGPFLNPPFFAELYVPFAAIPYRPALRTWVGLNVLLLCGSALLLCRMLPRGQRWTISALACLLIMLPLPFWEAVWYQQNTFLSLFLTCAIVSLWRRTPNRSPAAQKGGRGSCRAEAQSNTSARQQPRTPKSTIDLSFLAGLLCGLLFYKPQLALTIAAALAISRGRRALAGLIVTGSLLLLFTLLYMPGTLGTFIHTLPPTIQWLRTALPYNWGQQLTPQSFWRLLIQGNHMGETGWLPRFLGTTTSVLFGVALAWAALRVRQAARIETRLDRLIAATICTMPLLMPYYMDYDLLLLAVPAALFAAEWIASPHSITRADRILFGAWIALFVSTYVNPGLGAHWRLNLAVPLIAVVAGLSIGRCFRTSVASEEAKRYDEPILAAAA